MDVPTKTVYLTLGALGVLSHLTFFRRTDVIDSSPTLGILYITVPALITLALHTLFNHSYLEAAWISAKLSFSYLGAVFGSMVIYRMYFHRLRSYPGPLAARISQLYHVAKISKKVDSFRHIHKLHQQYGEYVRIGPNFLSVADPDIVNIAHAHGTGFDKGNNYEAGKPFTTLQQMVDREMHDKRRKHGWEKVGIFSNINDSSLTSPGIHRQVNTVLQSASHHIHESTGCSTAC